jgi:hypothetical protein
MAFYRIEVSGDPKGEVFKLSGRWRWARLNNKGIETYGRTSRLIDVRAHVARLCRVHVGETSLIKIKDLT